MKRWFVLLIGLVVLSCNNERVIQLPEIENAEITEVLDVSPAYIFYDETQPDSTLFNRKNLIGTTNWLVNVDKRLTLGQVIPHIQHLQEKRKKASMHKNENAKNYFTCNDTSIGNLGFVEFKGINYTLSNKEINLETNFKITSSDQYGIKSKDSTSLLSSLSGLYYTDIDLKFGFKPDSYFVSQGSSFILNTEVSKSLFYDYLTFVINNPMLGNMTRVNLHFSESLSFQEYISIKSRLHKLEPKIYFIENKEIIY